MTLSLTLTDQELLEALRDAFLDGVEMVTGQEFDPAVEATKCARAFLAKHIEARLAGLVG